MAVGGKRHYLRQAEWMPHSGCGKPIQRAVAIHVDCLAETFDDQYKQDWTPEQFAAWLADVGLA